MDTRRVAAFPAETRAGNEPLASNENGRRPDLLATEVKRETSPGVFVDAMAYNGTVRALRSVCARATTF
jgi:hypothetical protein